MGFFLCMCVCVCVFFLWDVAAVLLLSCVLHLHVAATRSHAEVTLLHGRGTVWVAFTKITRLQSAGLFACMQHFSGYFSKKKKKSKTCQSGYQFYNLDFSEGTTQLLTIMHPHLSPSSKSRRNKNVSPLLPVDFTAATNPLFLAHYLICVNIFMRFQALLHYYCTLPQPQLAS